MGRIEDAVRAFLDEDDWPVEDTDIDGVFASPVAGGTGAWSLVTVVREEQDQVLFYSVYPGLVGEDRRAEAMVYVTRANWDLTIGSFELDLDSGELRFRTSLDLEDSEPTPALIRGLVHSNVVVMDRYLPGLEAVEGGTPAEAAIAVVEA